MIGITAYGVHIPFYRLSRSVVTTAWAKGAAAGEKAVAGPDEDSITMGVQACSQCLKSLDREAIDALYFSSLAPPYAHKQAASILAAALDLRTDITTLDFDHSLRAATGAMKAALDSVKAGSARSALVVASDIPVAPPDSPKELEYGDAAVALTIGDKDVAVSVEGFHSITSEFMDVWRLPRDRFCQEWEDRFIRDEGYMRLLPELVSGLLNKYELKPGDFARAAYNGLDARAHRAVAKKLGLDYKTQVQDPLYTKVGNAGASSALLILISALEESKPGDRILFANYGDGGDAYVLRVTHDIEKLKKGSLNAQLNSKMSLDSYGRYLRFRELVDQEIDRRPAPRTSLTHYFRERRQIFGLVGQRCRKCGHEQYPCQVVCMWCQARLANETDYDNIRLAGQTGKLFTFSMDVRAPVADLPNVLCVVDLQGGARFYGLMTDRDPREIEIGQTMEFTFRKINDGQGVHNYFWKVRPVRS